MAINYPPQYRYSLFEQWDKGAFDLIKEIAEFVLRFILGQLGHDWEQTIMMIWEMLGDDNKLSVKNLNQEMKHFDYLKLFEE